MSAKDVIRKVYHKLLINNAGYIKYLRKVGVTIGEDVTFHSPNTATVDVQAPHLLRIGNHVNLTGPVTILTHDYSWSVIKHETGEILGNQKAVTIGNNVFVGYGATIMAGTTIENNTIIGAHAVVSGHITGNAVWAGVPARRICSLEEYAQKRRAAQLEEARSFVRAYRARWKRDPKPEELPQYFFLFAQADELNPVFEYQMHLMGSWDKSLEALGRSRVFDSFEAFLADCD